MCIVQLIYIEVQTPLSRRTAKCSTMWRMSLLLSFSSSRDTAFCRVLRNNNNIIIIISGCSFWRHPWNEVWNEGFAAAAAQSAYPYPREGAAFYRVTRFLLRPRLGSISQLFLFTHFYLASPRQAAPHLCLFLLLDVSSLLTLGPDFLHTGCCGHPIGIRFNTRIPMAGKSSWGCCDHCTTQV